DDAVEAELDFANVGDASSGAGFALAVAHRAGGVGDVDGVVTHAFAELTEATAGAARTNYRSLELGEGGAKFFGDDGGEGQDRGRAGDLDGVARLGESRGSAKGCKRDDSGAGVECGLHGSSLSEFIANMASRLVGPPCDAADTRSGRRRFYCSCMTGL